MNTAIIGMGTNLGDRMDNLNRAVQALKRLPRTKVTGASHLYETQPVGYLEQGPFLNRSEERRVGKECRSRWSPYH